MIKAIIKKTNFINKMLQSYLEQGNMIFSEIILIDIEFNVSHVFHRLQVFKNILHQFYYISVMTMVC